MGGLGCIVYELCKGVCWVGSGLVVGPWVLSVWLVSQGFWVGNKSRRVSGGVTREGWEHELQACIRL